MKYFFTQRTSYKPISCHLVSFYTPLNVSEKLKTVHHTAPSNLTSPRENIFNEKVKEKA